jgi:hypothetical protein
MSERQYPWVRVRFHESTFFTFAPVFKIRLVPTEASLGYVKRLHKLYYLAAVCSAV